MLFVVELVTGVISTPFKVIDNVTFSGLINPSVSLSNFTVTVTVSPIVTLSGLSTIILVPIKLICSLVNDESVA